MQTTIITDLDNLPINNALLQLVCNNSSGSSQTLPSNLSSAIANVTSGTENENTKLSSADGTTTTAKVSITTSSDSDDLSGSVRKLSAEQLNCYNIAKKCIEELALYLKPFTNGNITSLLSRPMQRKLVTLINCQLVEDEGRSRALRAARSLGERTVTELILQHQNPQQLSANLWAAVRARGCQFLGPAMQEEVLKLVLLALEDGSALSRKVLVMFVVQRLEPHFPQASKTSIGHVVQLLYRASCFKVSKREGDSSLMQLKEEFRTYEALRREHDAQIVQIATEAGLRIAPDQWSALLYGDTGHKSHMQSIIDKLQTPQSFAQSVQELVIALQRTNDPANLAGLRTYLNKLTNIDPTVENISPTWQEVASVLEAIKQVVNGLVEFVQHHGNRKLQDNSYATHNTKYKISMCRDLAMRAICPRGTSCTFAHSEEELEKYRAKNRKLHPRAPMIGGNGLGSDYLADSNSAHSYISSSNEDMSPQRYDSSDKSPKLPLKKLPTSAATIASAAAPNAITSTGVANSVQNESGLYMKNLPIPNSKGINNASAAAAALQPSPNLLHPNYEQASHARRPFDSPAKNKFGMTSSPPIPTQLMPQQSPHQYQNVNQINRSPMDYRSNQRFLGPQKYMHQMPPAPPPYSTTNHNNQTHLMNKFSPTSSARSPQHSSLSPTSSHIPLKHPGHDGHLQQPKLEPHSRMDDGSPYQNLLWDHQQPRKLLNAPYQQTTQFKSKPTQGMHSSQPQHNMSLFNSNGHAHSRGSMLLNSAEAQRLQGMGQHRRQDLLKDLQQYGNESMIGGGFARNRAAMINGNHIIMHDNENHDNSRGDNDTNNNDDNNNDDSKNQFPNSERFAPNNSNINHGMFIRSDSILDDDFIPFDTPTQSKCGPISRKSIKSSPFMAKNKESIDEQKPYSFCPDLPFGGGGSGGGMNPMESHGSSSSVWQYDNTPKSNSPYYQQSDLLSSMKPIQQITAANDPIASILSPNLLSSSGKGQHFKSGNQHFLANKIQLIYTGGMHSFDNSQNALKMDLNSIEQQLLMNTAFSNEPNIVS